MSARNNILIPVLCMMAWSAAAELPMEGLQLKTLFTTPEERALIDRNRYREEPRVRTPEPAAALAPQPEPEQEKPMVRVEKEYQISGISINADGVDVAWINGEEYENGARIDGAVRLRISARDGRLKLIAPDGKIYPGSAGDVLKVSYQKPAE